MNQLQKLLHSLSTEEHEVTVQDIQKVVSSPKKEAITTQAIADSPLYKEALSKFPTEGRNYGYFKS